MIARRGLLGAAIGAAVVAPAWAQMPVPAGRKLGFAVVRNGSRIGQHLLFFEPEGARLVVRVEVDITVTFGPITLYRYRHRARETWDGAEVAAFEAATGRSLWRTATEPAVWPCMA